MDVVARSRRLLLTSKPCGLAFGASCVLAAFGLSAAACDRPPESPVGVSSKARARASQDGGAPNPRASTAELAILPRDFRTRYAKLSATRFVSAGHASGRFDVEVYANDLGQGGMGKRAGDFARGSVFVKEHWERTPEGAKPGPLMAMEKMPPGFDPEHGDWRYVVMSAEGELLSDGKPDGCVFCHDDAPHDRIFLIK